jgi:hypothetical protein
MRQLSANIVALIANDQVEAFYTLMVRHYPDGFVFFNTTTYYQDIELSNGDIFLADGKLVSADPPQMNTNVDREEYKVVLADPGAEDGDLLGQGLVGKGFEVRLVFINPATGRPYTNVEDTFVVYKGRVGSTLWLIDTDNDSRDIQIAANSPMASLEMVKGFYLGRDNIRANDPTDSCCDGIYEGSAPSTIKWGKK